MESALCEGGRAPGLRLIETMLWDGARVARLPLHAARMAAGARALGWALPDLAAALPAPDRVAPDAVAPDGVAPLGPARLRATCGADGAVTLEVAALPPAKAEWRLGLAETRLSSGDPWLGVKSTRRAAYDAARAALLPGLDEVVFLNERGEVCDGSITTLFFDRGEGMRTPPLRCGLLPGVLRADLAVPEEVLMAEELSQVRLWVGNALRGLIPAVWAGPADLGAG